MKKNKTRKNEETRKNKRKEYPPRLAQQLFCYIRSVTRNRNEIEAPKNQILSHRQEEKEKKKRKKKEKKKGTMRSAELERRLMGDTAMKYEGGPGRPREAQRGPGRAREGQHRVRVTPKGLKTHLKLIVSGFGSQRRSPRVSSAWTS